MSTALRTVVAALFAVGSACVAAQPAPQQQAAPQQYGAPQQQQPAAAKPAQSAAAGGSASTALNAAQDGEARRLFQELDRNRDGYLSLEELSSERARRGNWAAVDRNRDGRIAPSEFSTLKSAP
jgi:EF hand domain-containing protein